MFNLMIGDATMKVLNDYVFELIESRYGRILERNGDYYFVAELIQGELENAGLHFDYDDIVDKVAEIAHYEMGIV